MSNVQQSIVDEETALLSDHHDKERKRTPIPKSQLAILLLLLSCELYTGSSILPYINQVNLLYFAMAAACSYFNLKLIGDLGITGGDNAKVGYYAGLIVELINKPKAKTGRNIVSGISVFCCGSRNHPAMGQNI
jgi:hypothetical protein